MTESVADIMHAALARLEGPQTDEPRPLRWDGDQWDRAGREPRLNAFMEPIPSVPIGPGWWVESLTQTWGDNEFEPVCRSGVVLDAHVNEDGELAYVCLETHQRFIHRLDVPQSDVRTARRSSRMVAAAREAVINALGGNKGWQVRCSKDWLAGTYPVLLSLSERGKK